MTPKRFTIWLDSAVLAEFERRAKQQRRSVSWVIREVLVAAVAPASTAEPQMTDAQLSALKQITEVKEFKPKE